jgi:homocysteine S-methyltransferase
MTIKAAGPDWLTEMLARGDLVLLDGAMGTELQARGVPMDGLAWSGAAALTHPKVCREIHADYIRAGADVIIANTFSSGRHMLEPAGFGEQVAEVNRQAVTMACQAREEAADHPVAVAGSLCEWVPAEGSPWSQEDKLAEALQEQADLLAEAGVDFLTLEMCQRKEHSLIAYEAAAKTGLPVWCGLSCRRDDPDGDLRGFDDDADEDFEGLVQAIAACGPAVMNIMHSPIADTAAGLDLLRQYFMGPMGAYPESGYFTMPNWNFVEVIAPEDLVKEAESWIALGAQILGGCCGLNPEHIKALKQGLMRE